MMCVQAWENVTWLCIPLRCSALDHAGKGGAVPPSWGRERRGGAFADNLLQFFPYFPPKNNQNWGLLTLH